MNHKIREQGKSVDSQKATDGKYFMFVLGPEEYGFEISKDCEIVALVEITPPPKTLNYVKGVINIHGISIPLIDLRLKLGFPPREDSMIASIIAVKHNDVHMGLVVDAVSEALNIEENEITHKPNFWSTLATDFITGIVKIKGKVKILLEMKKVIESEKAILT